MNQRIFRFIRVDYIVILKGGNSQKSKKISQHEIILIRNPPIFQKNSTAKAGFVCRRLALKAACKLIKLIK